MNENIILHTQLNRDQVIGIMDEQIDTYPSLAEIIFSFNARYWKGNSPVCGSINGNGANFKIQNRQGPGFSLIAHAKLVQDENGTQVHLKFSKPYFLMRFSGLLFNRYEKDREVILNFLEKWLETNKNR